jgi:hypothetical protein
MTWGTTFHVTHAANDADDLSNSIKWRHQQKIGDTNEGRLALFVALTVVSQSG